MFLYKCFHGLSAGKLLLEIEEGRSHGLLEDVLGKSLKRKAILSANTFFVDTSTSTSIHVCLSGKNRDSCVAASASDSGTIVILHVEKTARKSGTLEC